LAECDDNHSLAISFHRKLVLYLPRTIVSVFSEAKAISVRGPRRD
jgi:hypothetical protein